MQATLLCAQLLLGGFLLFLFLYNGFFAYLALIQNAMHGASTSTPLTTRDDSIAIDTLDELLLYFGATNGLLMMQLLFLLLLASCFHLGG